MLQISQEKEKDLFPLSSVSPRTGIPCVQPDPAAPVKSGSLELPTAALCSLLGLESRIPRKRAEADAFCMLISTKHMPGIQCIRHAAASEKLEHFGAAFLHISYLLLNTARAAAPLL